MEGCLHESLHDLPSVDPAVLAHPADVRTQSSLDHLQSVRALGTLAGCLEAADVPWLVMKGAVLANLLYGDGGLRRSIDIDVLVPRHGRDGDLEHAREVAEEVRPLHLQVAPGDRRDATELGASRDHGVAWSDASSRRMACIASANRADPASLAGPTREAHRPADQHDQTIADCLDLVQPVA